MKNKISKYLGITLIGILFFSCQDLERPEFSDFLYDGPIITLSTPSESGATVIRSKDPIASITIKFQVEDDLGLANINVKLDDVEITNISDFDNNRLLIVDDLTSDVSTGSHTLVITATDINDVVITKTATFEKVDIPPYTPLFEGEQFYMAFDGNYSELVSGNDATPVGSPSFTEDAKVGSGAYMGATDSYLTFPATDLQSESFSATMWYNLNATPDRGGILVMGPEDTGNANYPSVQNNRKNGFRFFRENGADGFQRFKLNVGNGTADTWVDGGTAADVANNAGWVHLAFTISPTNAIVYVNGVAVKESVITGVNWSGCDILSIMSGAPRFTEWGHISDLSNLDDLRIFNKTLTQEEITGVIASGNQTFKMSFDNNLMDVVSQTEATIVGSPSFTEDAKVGSGAYMGATDSYLTFPATDLQSESFSATMWYNLNATPDRGGILVMGPEDTGNANYPSVQNNRKNGFRFFRENGADGFQRFKLNVGNGTADTWVDGGTAADVANNAGWVHLAFTISPTNAIVYVNGVAVKESVITGVNWSGCDILSIMSGAPRFTEWGHISDLSNLDELALYNKMLSQEEIMAIMNAN